MVNLLTRTFPRVKFSVKCEHDYTYNVSWVDGPTDESVSEIIKVDDISGKNKKEDVLSKFGEPTNRETLDTGSEIITYETNNNDNSYVEFWFTKDNIISTIMIKNI